MDDLASPSVIRDPYPLYAELRGAQVMREGAGIDGWLVSRYHDVRRVLTDSEAFGSPPNRLSDKFQFASTVSKAAVELRRAEIEAAIAAHLDRLPSDLPVDIIAKFAIPLVESLIPELSDGPSATERNQASRAFVRIAGIETTVALLGNAIAAFARHPAQWGLLRSSPELLPSAVEECLRYDGPTHFVVRTALLPSELHGTPVLPGAILLALLASANRDEAVIPDAGTFQIDRRPRPHLAFGAGPHYCLGANIARAVCEAVLRRLAERFATLACDENSLVYRAELGVRSLESLVIVGR